MINLLSLLVSGVALTTPDGITGQPFAYAFDRGDKYVVRMEPSGKDFTFGNHYVDGMFGDNTAGIGLFWVQNPPAAYSYSCTKGFKAFPIPKEVVEHQVCQFSMSTNRNASIAYIWSPANHRIYQKNGADPKWYISAFTDLLGPVNKVMKLAPGSSGNRISPAFDDQSIAIEVPINQYANESGDESRVSTTWLLDKRSGRAVHLGQGSPLGWVDANTCLLWKSSPGNKSVTAVDRNGVPKWHLDSLQAASVLNGILYVAKDHRQEHLGSFTAYDRFGKPSNVSIRASKRAPYNDSTSRTICFLAK